MFPVIVSIAKKERDYIEEFVVYHLKLGFKHIYLYDNEDTPTYECLLNKYKEYITFIHYPFNNYDKPVQYKALDHFVHNYLHKDNITHVLHIDIDEYVALKKHDNISDFINDYIVNDCEGIGINWRFFGSSKKSEKTNEPNTIRFTMCQSHFDQHIKTLFKKDNFVKFETVHDITLKSGYIKATNNNIINGSFSQNGDISVIQLNHYKSKTWPEFEQIRKRFRADMQGPLNEDVAHSFKCCDINEVEDLTAHNFYKKHIADA
jgi:hypothetical protein